MVRFYKVMIHIPAKKLDGIICWGNEMENVFLCEVPYMIDRTEDKIKEVKHFGEKSSSCGYFTKLSIPETFYYLNNNPKK